MGGVGVRRGWGWWSGGGIENSTLIPSSPLEEIRRVVYPDHQLGSRTRKLRFKRLTDYTFSPT